MAALMTLGVFVCLVQCLDVAFGRRRVPGGPYDVSVDDPQVLKVALSAADVYNNQSNDAFLFKLRSVHKAQKQVVKGVRFLVDVDLSRTVCDKRDRPHDLHNCDLQPPGPLHQVVQCHLEVWSVPWKRCSFVQRFFCKSANQTSRGGAGQSESSGGSGVEKRFCISYK